ncbi:Molybdenum ABC transporter, periplasmic binding protein [Moorella glycerini]|uniref:Binding protein n=1 Tax=Neomoorella stamsii TaxID=1266720 RepID=A0A9X7J4C6_9FIRM|nr:MULTISPECIES: molybdate ABC transporter substrate-binding protein [Moorella]PRR75600.1 putative binding protein precursor [Moorella stamsii]CEP66456.1 Molybdenum ABC transporter, periplasmic binding protein [Moorella glycerini]
MRRILKMAVITMLAMLAVLFLAGCTSQKESVTPGRQGETKELQVFAGAASKPPLEEIATLFMQKYGVKVNLTFGGSGTVLSQMKLSRQGDIYIPGSSDFMEMAKKEGVVDPKTEQILVYLIPAINVPKGNPQGIRSLNDLARPGMRVGLARPETVCVGLYGVEILEKAGLADKVKKNIVTYAESCEKTANLVALKQVDAVMGWDVFQKWDPAKIETIYLPPEQVTRIGYIPAAISSFSQQKELAALFLAFLTSEQGKEVFRKYGYLGSVEEARKFAPEAPVGGEYQLPAGWR